VARGWITLARGASAPQLMDLIMNLQPVKHRAGAEALNRRPVAAVVGSGSEDHGRTEEVGSLIARLDFHLLTGAGGGVMEAVSRAFFETPGRTGLVIGVVPGRVEPLHALEKEESCNLHYAPKQGYPNRWVEIALYTHLPDSGLKGTLPTSRNHIVVLSADAIVALPGGAGTRSEMWLATQYGVPVIAYGDHDDPPKGVRQASTIDEVRTFLCASCLTASGRNV
jgi:predicted Rossmann-fold nucleotide-binding protein